eukprot:m.49007 g.49007  ORF g.49007 m.49007 type:complete len:138 (+) comp11073_c0_seq4:783-1196(+)
MIRNIAVRFDFQCTEYFLGLSSLIVQRVSPLPLLPSLGVRVRFSPDGSLLATACDVGSVKLWNAVSGTCTTTLDAIFDGSSIVNLLVCSIRIPKLQTAVAGGRGECEKTSTEFLFRVLLPARCCMWSSYGVCVCGGE